MKKSTMLIGLGLAAALMLGKKNGSTTSQAAAASQTEQPQTTQVERATEYYGFGDSQVSGGILNISEAGTAFSSKTGDIGVLGVASNGALITYDLTPNEPNPTRYVRDSVGVVWEQKYNMGRWWTTINSQNYARPIGGGTVVGGQYAGMTITAAEW